MMLLEQIARHAQSQPSQPALTGLHRMLDYHCLLEEIRRLSQELRQTGIKVLALYADNTPAWVLADLAALMAGICLVPLPPFFSARQLQHAIRASGAAAVLTDNSEALQQQVGELLSGQHRQLLLAGCRMQLVSTNVAAVDLPDDIAKITFTSGTTGEPKGVLLRQSQIERVVESLCSAVEANPADRHLPLMPLAVLLENLGGIYVSLWSGGNSILPGLQQTGLHGSVGFDAATLWQAIRNWRPTSLILTPQTLHILLERMEQDAGIAASLRFVALGGAPVSPRLLQRAADLGLPLYEGYGLSECASVTTLNTPAAHRHGSVGRALPHIGFDIAEDGEVLISGHGFAGYLGKPMPDDEVWRSGDLGYLDADGFLYLTGRKRNVFITSMGRNVAPEWVERELLLEPEILQAAVFGEARPFNAAVITPHPQADISRIADAIDRVNQLLPDYARVARFVMADAPFTPANGQLSGTGRPRRQQIYQHYQSRIEACYSQEKIS
ncbi:MAG: AMP-binding protein [Chromatiales bacterium]|jgi:long-subunit acyl-CoA synthetase (AMP-forming)